MSRVLFIAPWYFKHSRPILVDALQEQTYDDFGVYLIHDGPVPAWPTVLYGQVHYDKTPTRHNDWGHSLRAYALERAAGMPWDFLVHTNSDNTYMPTFCEEMVRAFRPDDVAVFCNMVHNDLGYRFQEAEWERCKIDCGCVMVRREVALEIGWPCRNKTADWEGYMAPILKKYGRERIHKIGPVLFVHN